MKKKTFQPIIKWSGSKRSQAEEIVKRFPREIDTYYEPFVGSAAVLRKLLDEVERGNISCKKFVCSDINDDLIDMWTLIKCYPTDLMNSYEELYNKFVSLDIQGKKDFYKANVQKFNKLTRNGIERMKKAKLFFWIRRTAYNGLVRYNSKGGI